MGTSSPTGCHFIALLLNTDPTSSFLTTAHSLQTQRLPKETRLPTPLTEEARGLCLVLLFEKAPFSTFPKLWVVGNTPRFRPKCSHVAWEEPGSPDNP